MYDAVIHINELPAISHETAKKYFTKKVRISVNTAKKKPAEAGLVISEKN